MRRLALLCSVSALALGPVVGSRAGQLPSSAFQTYDPNAAGSIQAGPFALFTVPVNSIHPTQLNLGFVEIGKKTSAYDLLSPAGLANDLLTGGSIEPVVIGPGGVLYLTNGHHTFTSLQESIYGASNPNVYVNVIANYSNLTPAQFWAQMQASNFLLPLDNGVIKSVDPLTGAPIPFALTSMTNDPYRGLEYSILKNKSSVLFPNAANITGATGASTPGLDKTAAFYSDFIWANAYRGANNGLGLPFISPGDIAISTKWNLTGSSPTTLQNVGAITVAQMPGYILGNSISIGTPISDATLANGVLDGNGTFTGVRNQNLGSVTIGSTAPGFIMQLGADKGFNVTLSGANTYTGGTTILAGTLVVNNDSALGAAAPASFAIDPNNILASVQAANGITFNSLSEGKGTLKFGSSFTLNRPIAVSGEAATLDTNGKTITLAGPIVSVGPGANGLGSANGESDLTVNDSASGGKVILAPTSGSNSRFYGNWIISAGTLVASSDAALGNTTGPSYTIGQIVLDGGTFQAGASFSSVRSLNLTGGSTFDTNGFTTSFAGSVTDVQRTLTIINSSSANAGAVTFGTFNIGATATLALNGGTKGETVTFANVNRTDHASLVITPSTTTSLGTSEKVFSTSAPALTNGIVAPWTIINTSAASNNNLDFATYNGAAGYTVAAYSKTGTGTAAGIAVAASTDVVKETAGTTTLTANAQAYALNVQRNATIAGNVTLTLGDGTYAGLILNGTQSNPTTISTTTLNFGTSEAVIFAMGSQTSGSSNTISSKITGTGGLTLSGATNGILVLTNNTSTLSGAITVNSGTLRLAATDIFANNVNGITLGNVKSTAAILDLTASNTFTTLNSVGNNSSITLSNSAALTIGETGNANPLANNLDSTISSTITQSGSAVAGALTKNGSGMLDLTGVGNGKLTLVAGSTVVVNGGVLRMSASAFANPNAIVLNDSSELQLAEGGGSVLNNAVSGTGTLHLIGGTLKVAGTNSYIGGTIVEVGSTLDVTTANISTGNANITNAGGLIVFDQATSGTYGGVISDGRQMEATTGAFLSGSLVKDDSTGASSGNVTLAAKQAYTGGTFVEAGTLTLGVVDAIASSAGVDLGRVGGPLGTGAAAAGGPVTATLALGADNAIRGLMSEAGNNTAVTLNGHTLTINTAAGTTWSFGGVVSGSGALIKSGAGAEQLTGINTYTGPTTVNGGLLSVDGSIASSSLTTINAGGALGGNGTVGNTLINGGVLSPGNSIGTLTVTGSLAFTSAATYLVEVSPTSADRTNVGGAATLAGSVLAAFQPGSYVVNSYTILHSAGLGGTTFGGLTTSGLPANFNASLSYTATDVMLSLSAALGAGTSLPGNQQNVATSINNFFNNGGALPPNFLSLFNLTGGNLSNGLALISGETATGAQQGAFQMTSQFLSLMLDPFVDGRSGVGGAGGAIGFAPERAELPNDIALAYASVLKAPVFKAPSFEQRWGAWGAAYGGYNRTSGDPPVAGSHDLNARAAGFAAGLDYALARDTVIGVALAGGGTSWGLAQSLGNGRSDAFQGGVYGTTRWGASYVAASFAYTNHWMSTDRFAFAGDHLAASFNAQSAGGRIEGGYRVATAFGALTPYAAVQTQGFWTPSYRETDLNGGGFGLAYNARTATDTRTELGGRFDKQMLLDSDAVLALRGRLAWAHDVVSNPTLAAAFQTLPGASFIVNGATPAKNSALVSASAELRLKNGVSLLGKVDGEFANRSSTYAGTGTLRVSW